MSDTIGGTKIPTLPYPKLHRASEVYINAAFLDKYVEVIHAENTTWSTGRDPDAGRIRGQIYIESLVYQGVKYWHDQFLKWPRYPVYDQSGLLISNEETPYDIFNAVAEAAYWETQEPGILQPKESDSDIYPLQSTRVKAGSVESEKGFDTQGKRVVKSADRLILLQGYLYQWTQSVGKFVQIART